MVMMWSLATRSCYILVGLIVSFILIPVSGQDSHIILTSNVRRAHGSLVYTGVYSAGTPVSDLVNESKHLSYLPNCLHLNQRNTYVLELYRTDTKTVIRRSNGPVGASNPIYWLSSPLYPNDSATYGCRTSLGEVADRIYTLSVVYPVKISGIRFGKVLINSTFEAFCCAEGFPMSRVLINDTVADITNNSTSNGVQTVCGRVTLKAPPNYGEFPVTCEASLSSYSCSQPAAAMARCAIVQNTTTSTVTTIANIPQCSTRPSAKNGNLKYTNMNNFRSVANLSCVEGYILGNDTFSECLGTGNWSIPFLTCKDKDECTTQPCGNHGTCNNTIGNYTCMCAPGWTGRRCSDNVNECADGTHNCSNKATCNDTRGSFQCNCTNGFFGDGIVCKDINECNSTNAPLSKCDKHADCANTLGSHECSCMKGFSGDGIVCSDINECSDKHDCSDHSTCNNTVGSFKCPCNKGFYESGRFCLDNDECEAGDPCANSGTCLNTVGSYQCTCVPQYTGPRCTDQKCKHGSLVGSECDCAFGWKGDLCDKPDVPVIVGITIAGCIAFLLFIVLCYVMYRKLKTRPDSVPPGVNRKNFKEWEERDLELERREQEAQQDSKHDDEAAATSTFSGSHSGDEYTRLMRSDQKKQQPTSAAGGETYAQLNRQGSAPAYEDANPVPPGSIEMADLPANEAQYDRLDRGSKPAPQKTTTNVNYEYTQANFPPPPEAAGNEPKLDYAALEQKEPTETFDSGAAAAGKTVYSQVVPKSQRNQSESEN